MQWEGITEFVYVAENEGFTRASRKLGISTAQVSRQVSALETRLRVKLFYRTTRKVSLTEEGQLFYQHCRGVLDGLDNAERAITSLHSTPQGRVKLSAPVTFGEQQILPLLNDYMLQYPEVTVTAYLTNQQVDLVNEGYDLAIRIGKLADSSMMARKLSCRTSYVCAAPAYIEKHGKPDKLDELARHRCLTGTLDYWRFSQQGQFQNIKVCGAIQYNSGYGLVDAALKGLGLVQLPDYYVQQYLDNGSLISVLDEYRVAEEGIWAVYPHNRHLSAKVKTLVDFLCDRMG